MKYIRALLLIFVILISAMFIDHRVSYACSCVPIGSVDKELKEAKAVFSGKVIEIKQNKRAGYYSVLFEVSKTWKGVKTNQIIIKTGLGGGDCGFSFVKGQNYLVYAHESEMYGKKSLNAIICSRTNELSSSQEDLTLLGDGKVPAKKVDYLKEFRRENSAIILKIIIISCAISILLVFLAKTGNKKRKKD
jgi:hypothetical protein